MDKEKASILVVEDEVAIAIDIALNLEACGYEIAGIVHNKEDAILLLETKAIDLVMLDINLGNAKSGIEVAKLIVSKFGIPFIFLTSYSDKETMDAAISTLPSSYLIKPYKERDLAPAVKLALLNTKSKSKVPPLELINQKNISKVTQAEYTVLKHLCQGMTNLEIANDLFISKNTVKTHIRSIYSKLGVNSKSLLINYISTL